MGFIAHFHRASLLALREELSKSMNKDGLAFHNAVINIQKNCTRFRTRYWYHEVSTQLQGQELFRWWSNKLGNQELFDKVTSDVEALASLVRTEIAERESENVKSLTFYGLLVGFIGVLVGALSAVLAHLLGDWSKVTSYGYIELVILIVVCFVTCFFLFPVRARLVNR
jgi:VIT1/CCC1 family predicted Fe2+/Mn2+ transporter